MVIAKVVINYQDQILILTRSKTHPKYAHQFDLPGGEAEKDESGLDAVAREVEEETGLVIPHTEFELVFEEDLTKEDKHLVYKADLKLIEPIIRLSWEHSDYSWLSRTSLLEYTPETKMDPCLKTVIDYLQTL